jgi:hypothetical protein
VDELISEVSENVIKLGTFLEEYADEIEDHLDMKKPSKHEGRKIKKNNFRY